MSPVRSKFQTLNTYPDGRRLANAIINPRSISGSTNIDRLTVYTSKPTPGGDRFQMYNWEDAQRLTCVVHASKSKATVLRDGTLSSPERSAIHEDQHVYDHMVDNIYREKGHTPPNLNQADRRYKDGWERNAVEAENKYAVSKGLEERLDYDSTINGNIHFNVNDSKSTRHSNNQARNYIRQYSSFARPAVSEIVNLYDYETDDSEREEAADDRITLLSNQVDSRYEYLRGKIRNLT